MLDWMGLVLESGAGGFWIGRRLCAIFHQVKWTIVNKLQFIQNVINYKFLTIGNATFWYGKMGVPEGRLSILETGIISSQGRA